MSPLTRAKVPPPDKPIHDWAAFVEWCRVNGRKVNIDSLIAFRARDDDRVWPTEEDKRKWTNGPWTT